MQDAKIDWCEGGMQLTDIITKNLSEPDLTPRMRYIMVRCKRGDRVQASLRNKISV